MTQDTRLSAIHHVRRHGCARFTKLSRTLEEVDLRCPVYARSGIGEQFPIFLLQLLRPNSSASHLAFHAQSLRMLNFLRVRSTTHQQPISHADLRRLSQLSSRLSTAFQIWNLYVSQTTPQITCIFHYAATYYSEPSCTKQTLNVECEQQIRSTETRCMAAVARSARRKALDLLD